MDKTTEKPPKKLKLGDQTVFFQNSNKMSGTPDQSVDLFVTSPPYWNLKDYGGPEGSIGLTPSLDRPLI
jgi:DNA modification methylase